MTGRLAARGRTSRITGAPRVLIGVSIAATVTLASVVVGGIPLLLGLGSAAAAMLAVLPGGSRRYLLRRASRVVASIVVAMAIVWFLMFNLPPSPSIRFADDQSIGGPGRSPFGSLFGEPEVPTGVLAAMRAYGSWLGDLVLGDLGPVTTYSETVGEGVSRTIPLSFQLLLYSQIVALLVAVPAALLGARYRGRAADVAARAVGFVGLSAPVYLLGPFLVYVFAVGRFELFGVEFGARVLPSGRYVAIGTSLVGHLKSMALPSITLGLSTAAVYLVLLRSELLQQLQLDHVQLARAKGVPPRRIIRRHALRPATPTLIAALAAQSGLLIGNMIIVERIFLLPGFGDYVIVSIVRRDLPAIVGAVFVSAVILGVINLFADALLLAADPRLDRRN